MKKICLFSFLIVFFLNICIGVDVYYVDIVDIPIETAKQPQRRPVQAQQRPRQRTIAQPPRQVVRRPVTQRQQVRQPQRQYQQIQRQQQLQRLQQQPQRRQQQFQRLQQPQRVQRRPAPQQLPEIDTIIVIEEPDDPVQPQIQNPNRNRPVQRNPRPQTQGSIATQQRQHTQSQQQPKNATESVTEIPSSTTKSPPPIANQTAELTTSTNSVRQTTVSPTPSTEPTKTTESSTVALDHAEEDSAKTDAKLSNSSSGNNDRTSAATTKNNDKTFTTTSRPDKDITNKASSSPAHNKDTDKKSDNAADSGAETDSNSIENHSDDGGEYGENEKWLIPHRPNANRFLDFAGIFNEMGQKIENDYDASVEMNELRNDFDGRSVVAPGQYPHMAALGYRTYMGETEFMCGGSLISELFVLTAAHCCFLNGEAPHLVKIGEIRLKDDENYFTPQQRGIARVITHPYYNKSMYYNDIGLLQLTNAVDFTYFVRPIRLWCQDELPYNKVFTMGYGSTSFAKAATNILTELDLSIVSLDKCNKTLPHDPHAPFGLKESQICAKDLTLNRDTCQGDSGGPLQLNLQRPWRRRMQYYLVGVISYGTFCRSQYPGVYTKVSSYIDWIASVVWPEYFNSFSFQ